MSLKKSPTHPAGSPGKDPSDVRPPFSPSQLAGQVTKRSFQLPRDPMVQGLLELPATPHPNDLIVVAVVVADAEAARGKAANN